ncbi:unnamed protein product [Gongylonema pulchrum]|uniref:Helicase C-terminal domain-containing protein n=1 Tax=Gongylonema pulchrum TaxID=637853 RepID=A0A183EDN1_9BILA|nr:unnamed protein product [Gongylonema pulchrum]
MQYAEGSTLPVAAADKLDKLVEILEEEKKNNRGLFRTLIFVQTKRTADAVALNLAQRDIPSTSINGDRDQRQREEALRDFRTGAVKVLVATDVCARGLDVKDLEHVINYDMPHDRVTYVHRIGRTGRLHEGKATSLIDPVRDNVIIDSIVKVSGSIIYVVQEVQQVPPQFMLDLARGYGSLRQTGFGSGGFSSGTGGDGFSKGSSKSESEFSLIIKFFSDTQRELF